MMTREFRIQGMTCNHCVMAVQKGLTKVAGVTSADVKIGSALVSFDEHKTTEQHIRSAIQETGYFPEN